MDRPDQFMGIAIIAYIIAIIFFLKYKVWGASIYLIIVLVIYWKIGFELNQDVREASTHGNTIHGWYSKKNGEEKTVAILWFICFPIASIVLPIWIAIKFGKDK